MECSAPLLRCLQFISLLLLIASSNAKQFYVPRLSPTGPLVIQDPEVASLSISEDFETFFYTQTLDHFNYNPESYNTFQQRYVINSKYWGGANSSAPIFVYLGAEEPLDGDIPIIGFLPENAVRFNALLVYIEHRYYGKSIPLGSRDEALKNASTLGYFSSVQAIADYGAIIIHLKEELQAQSSPVIVVGGSYGGMLASWFRLKYPHIALGALASSAPILYFVGITPPESYYSVVSKDFREASETCFHSIKYSWAEIDRVASQTNGLSTLSLKFKTCKPLNNSGQLKDHLEQIYTQAAQYNAPPKYPVSLICKGIDGDNASGGEILGKIFAGLVAYKGNQTCYVNAPRNLTETDVGWRWQTCSDMVIPIDRGNGGDDSMFPADRFDLDEYIEDCKSVYGVSPRPYWATTYYGGENISLILQRFGSNIIFSNGLRDPYSSGGVSENISDSVIAVSTTNGSHCLDILNTKVNDPDWLVEQRKREVKIIEDWITKYYDDLLAYEQKNNKTKDNNGIKE